MSMTVKRMGTLAAQAINGQNPQAQNPEEEKFLQRMQRDIAKAKVNGYTLSIPSEWPDFDASDECGEVDKGGCDSDSKKQFERAHVGSDTQNG